MSNPVWSLTNRTIDNRGTRVNPKLTTVTPSNPEGWETLFTFSDSTNTVQYKIDPQGRVGYREGKTGRQFANLQQYADWLAGNASVEKIQDFINFSKQKIAGVLTTRTQNTIPSQPPPQEAGAQGGADSGANNPASGISTTYNLDEFQALENVLDNFESTSFNKIKAFLYYPQNIGTSGQDKIVISQLEYVPGNLAGALTENSLGNRESQFNEQATKQKLIGSVVLPIPNDLSEANQTGWGEDSLSSITAALMGAAIPKVQQIASGRVAATIGDLDAIKSALGNSAVSTRLTQFLTVNAAASVLKFGGIQVNPEAYITRATGAAVNPNLELLFQGPKLRQFGFTFKMSPRSAEEARNIRSILKFFKKGMAPRRSKERETSIFLGTPNVFRIKFQSGNNEIGSIGKIKTCALVSCNINYTPDGFYAAFNDSATGSQPVSVNMQLGFTELTPIFNDEYDGDKSEVGPENIFQSFDLKPAQETRTDSNPRSPENARRQAAAEGRPLPGDIPISRTPGATGRSAGTNADLREGLDRGY